MARYKAIPQGYMTVGEVAKKMSVTARALQYYDREGLFSPSCISEGGRRLYSDKDIVKLHQILTFKSLGFSFDEIKNRLTSIDTPQKAIIALTEQSNSIQTQINTLTQSLQAIELLKNEIEQMQTVDFSKYADIIVNLQMGNKYYGLIKYFDDNMLDYCHKKFDKDTGVAFINKFNLIVHITTASQVIRGISLIFSCDQFFIIFIKMIFNCWIFINVNMRHIQLGTSIMCQYYIFF